MKPALGSRRVARRKGRWSSFTTEPSQSPPFSRAMKTELDGEMARRRRRRQWQSESFGAEEIDPDIIVELVNGVFYQASWDGALVAITADYPGLILASHVSRAKKTLSFEEDSSQVLQFIFEVSFYLQKRRPERGAEPLGTRQPRASRSGRLKRKAVRVDTPLQR